MGTTPNGKISELISQGAADAAIREFIKNQAIGGNGGGRMLIRYDGENGFWTQFDEATGRYGVDESDVVYEAPASQETNIYTEFAEKYNDDFVGIMDSGGIEIYKSEYDTVKEAVDDWLDTKGEAELEEFSEKLIDHTTFLNEEAEPVLVI